MTANRSPRRALSFAPSQDMLTRRVQQGSKGSLMGHLVYGFVLGLGYDLAPIG